MSNCTKLSQKLRWFIVITVLTAYAALSLQLSGQKSVWRDEAFSMLISQQSVADIIKSTSIDFNPPLFYILLHLWQRVAGQGIEFQRVLPLIFSLATILTIYLTLPKVLNTTSNVFKYLLLFFLVTNGSIFYYSYELRTYSLMMWLAYLVFYLGYVYITKPKTKHTIFLMISSFCLIYTQTLGIFWFGIVGVGLGLQLAVSKKWQLLVRLLLLWTGIALLYLPWAYIVLNQFKNFTTSFWLVFNPDERLKNLASLFAHSEGPRYYTEEVYQGRYIRLYRFLELILLIGAVKKGIARIMSLLVFVSLVILYYASYLTPLFYGRYFVYMAPFASASASIGIYYLIQSNFTKVSYRLAKLALAGGLVILYITGLYPLWGDYFRGVSRVNYNPLKAQEVDHAYVTNSLDIMPCMVYKPQCYYIGGRDKIKNYIGILQLKWQPILDKLEDIQGDQIAVLYRDEEYEELSPILDEKGYKSRSQMPLGEGAYLVSLKK